MNTGHVLEREEYIEQAYFFRVLRERLAENLAMQEVLERLHEEILSSTRLPLAIQFLTGELKHTGLLSSGFALLPHYFHPFQTFVIAQAEEEKQRFTMPMALLVLQREAQYRADQPTRAGLFVYQFETVCRNRLGYDPGLLHMADDPFYDAAWRDFLLWVHRQGGLVDFCDMVYFRSQQHVLDRRRRDPDYEPAQPVLFAEKEGKIAKASHGRDPLFLFAALQRQLGYPEVPRPTLPDDLSSRFVTLQAKVRLLEARLQLVESELRGQVDLSQFGKPDLLKDVGKAEEGI
ncbi:MAG: hypothetical protein ACK4RK_04000 [Gemmataceae bacterium]